MIQRIQSVYLLISAVALGLLFLFPYAFSLGEDGFPLFVKNNIVLMITTVSGLAISFITIFLFKYRSLQKKLAVFVMLVSLFIGGYMLYEYFMGDDYNLRAIQLGQFLPLGSLFFGLLAYLGIKNDDKKVRSMDRLR